MCRISYRKVFDAGVPMLVVPYPLDQFDFRDWARATLSVDSLELLHLRPDPLAFANYTERLRYYADLLANNFGVVQNQFCEFVDRVVAPFFGGVLNFQTRPSFRCHLVGAGTASAFHRDGDEKYGIVPGSINGWLPLTPVGGNNSIYIETEFDSEVFRPIELQPGELLIFDAYHLRHGSYGNDTNQTRVSFDFRFRPANRDRARALGLYAREPLDRSGGQPAQDHHAS